jgi:hypothetical protein
MEPDQETIDRLARNLAEVVPDSPWDRLTKEATEIRESALAGWPVLTGRSRAAFSVLRGDDSVTLRNTAPYAFAVRFKGSGANAWEQLVANPARARLGSLLRDLADEAAAAAVEG